MSEETEEVEEITLSTIRTKIMGIMFCFGDTHINRKLGTDRCDEAINTVTAYEKQYKIWASLDNAIANGFDLHAQSALEIAEDLGSYDAEFDRSTVDDVLGHIQAWLCKRRSSEMTDPE